MHSTENGSEPGVDQSPAALRTAGLSVSGPIPGPVSAAANNVVSAAGTGTIKECAGCGKRITERFLLRALELFWHEDCLKCGCCDCRLGEVGSTLYTKANLILCKRDYLRLFGTTGYCAACNKVIPAFEMVMRAKNNVYHLECFACQQCNHRFCVGDRFYLCENKILCEYDYEERLVFANMAYNPSSLAHIRSVKNLAEPQRLRTRYHPTPMGVANICSAPPIPRPDQLTVPKNNFPPIIMGPANGNVGAFGPEGRVGRPFGGVMSGCLDVPVGRGVGLMDDGSSGYGSPDSETLESVLPNYQ